MASPWQAIKDFVLGSKSWGKGSTGVAPDPYDSSSLVVTAGKGTLSTKPVTVGKTIRPTMHDVAKDFGAFLNLVGRDLTNVFKAGFMALNPQTSKEGAANEGPTNEGPTNEGPAKSETIPNNESKNLTSNPLREPQESTSETRSSGGLMSGLKSLMIMAAAAMIGFLLAGPLGAVAAALIAGSRSGSKTRTVTTWSTERKNTKSSFIGRFLEHYNDLSNAMGKKQEQGPGPTKRPSVNINLKPMTGADRALQWQMEANLLKYNEQPRINLMAQIRGANGQVPKKGGRGF